jgi:ligand-binding sensor domain-containing protein
LEYPTFYRTNTFCLPVILFRNILLFICFCQTSILTIGQSAFRNYKLSDDNAVKISSLTKNKQGLIYVGANTGLFRFDGLDFVHIPFVDSLKIHQVSALFCDSKNTIWCGLQTGQIYCLKKGQMEMLTIENALSKVAINDFAEDALHRIWLATSGEGIYYWAQNKLQHITVDDGLADDYVYDLEYSSDVNSEGMYASTDQGISICSVDEKQVKKITAFSKKFLLSDNITRICKKLDEQQFLVGMQEGGYAFLKNNSAANVQQQAIGQQINDIALGKNVVYLSSEQEGIYVLPNINDPVSNHHVDTLHFKGVAHILIDNEGSLWFTKNNELVKYIGEKMSIAIQQAAAISAKVHAVYADQQNDVFVNQGNSIVQYRNIENRYIESKRFTLPNITSATGITSIYKSTNNFLWVGTMGNGLFIIDLQTGQIKQEKSDANLQNGSILSINGQKNIVWIASLAGATKCIVEPNGILRFEDYTNVKSLGTNYIYQCFPDSKGNVWFATDGKGITKFDQSTYVNYAAKQGLLDPVVYGITEDKEGYLWLSTNGGVYTFDGKKFTAIGLENGIDATEFTSIVTDAYGNILVSTNKGLLNIDPKTRRAFNVDKQFGIANLNSNLNIVSTDQLGNVLFAVDNAIVRFNSNHSSALFKPSIFIDSITQSLQTIDSNIHIFKHNENNFQFHFTGVYYLQPENVQYEYQLIGYNNNWVNTKDRSISFFELPPGDYTFNVMASINNHFENVDKATYHFTIKKPFWKTWWFILLSLFSFGFLTTAFMKMREARKTKIQFLENNNLRAQFETLKSQVNPHFLFNSFNTLISLIEDSPKQAVSYVENLSDFFRTIVTLRGKDLISLKEELELIKTYLFIQQKRFGNGLRLEINTSNEEKIFVPPLTLQLLIENALKHNAIGKDTPLLIKIYMQDGKLIVSNNLNVKLTKEPSTGTGIENIRSRYKMFTKIPVEVAQTNQDFIIYLPLIDQV